MNNLIEIIIFSVLICYAAYNIYILKKAWKDYPNSNHEYIDLIPSIFTTIGILGTFAGIIAGLHEFNANKIDESITDLLNGLKTAFYASIGGIVFSIIFSKVIAYIKNKNEKGVQSEETVAINKLIESINLLRNDFQSIDENGNTIQAGNILRDLYKESTKQSIALQTFTNELAMTIAAGFEEVFNNPAGAVVEELKAVKTEIENLGNKLKDPATDMTQNIVKELQDSLAQMMADFKTSMSGDTKNEMEQLAKTLSIAGGSLASFPEQLQSMTENLNQNFKALQNIVDDISQKTNQQSEESISKIKDQVDAIATTIASQLGGLQRGQENLIKDQGTNIKISENLLNAFNISIEKMNNISNEISDNYQVLNEAKIELNKTAGAFRVISQEVATSSSKFGESQSTFSVYTNEFLEKNSETIHEIQSSLNTAKNVATDYAQKFEIIENGLSNIFAELSKGLQGYQTTVADSLETYLGKYSEALTHTAESLAGAAEKQSDILDELTEQLSKLKGNN